MGLPSTSGWNYRYRRKILPADDVLGSDPVRIGSDHNPLDLVERDLVTGTVIEPSARPALPPISRLVARSKMPRRWPHHAVDYGTARADFPGGDAGLLYCSI